jgi:hypothetical protein
MTAGNAKKTTTAGQTSRRSFKASACQPLSIRRASPRIHAGTMTITVNVSCSIAPVRLPRVQPTVQRPTTTAASSQSRVDSSRVECMGWRCVSHDAMAAKYSGINMRLSPAAITICGVRRMTNHSRSCRCKHWRNTGSHVDSQCGPPCSSPPTQHQHQERQSI